MLICELKVEFSPYLYLLTYFSVRPDYIAMIKKLIMRRTFTFDVNAFDMQINVSPLELKQVKK